MQMFMYEAWKHKPEYGVYTQYCNFTSNIYFELYKTKNEPFRYYVFYYIDEELINIFDYDEFDKTVREHIYSQDDIAEYCSNDKEKKEKEEKEEKKEKESFSESFISNKALWITIFIFVFTTILGIIGIIILLLKIRQFKKLGTNINTKDDINLKLMENID